MSLLFCRMGVVLLSSATIFASARAEEASHIWDAPITRVWLEEHVAARPHTASTGPAYRLSRTQMWASGIAPRATYAFTPSGLDRVVGAKLQPFHDLNLRVGTQLTHSGEVSHPLSGAANWEAFWTRDVKQWGGLALGLSTTGSVDYAGAGYSQALIGSLGIPLDLSSDRWRTELRLSPRMNVDLTGGSIDAGLLSEVMGQTVISARHDTFRSILNVRIGYSLTPEARPAASARLELRISPNL